MPREIRRSTPRTSDAGKAAKGDKTSTSSKPDTRQGRDLLARQGSSSDKSALQRLKERLGRGEIKVEPDKVKALGHDNWGPRYAGNTKDIEDMLLTQVGARRQDVYGYSSRPWNKLPDGTAAREYSLSYKYVFRDEHNRIGTMEGHIKYTHVVDKASFISDM